MQKITVNNLGSVKYYSEDLCLLLLLKSMCLKHMSSPLMAEECLKEILSYSGKLRVDAYLVPYAMFEYALILRDQGNNDKATELLETAK